MGRVHGHGHSSLFAGKDLRRELHMQVDRGVYCQPGTREGDHSDRQRAGNPQHRPAPRGCPPERHHGRDQGDKGIPGDGAAVLEPIHGRSRCIPTDPQDGCADHALRRGGPVHLYAWTGAQPVAMDGPMGQLREKPLWCEIKRAHGLPGRL